MCSVLEPFQGQERIWFFFSSSSQNGQGASASAQAGKVTEQEGTKQPEYNFLFLAC